ncbi:MAG: pyridoxal-phosphate dependent enzyme [Anaerolineales bacterium]|nr:pyridoxal-phosphate dependent enzyme [Anaerolineales bacterium]
MMTFKCTSCGRPQPLTFTGFLCPTCTGLLGLAQPPVFDAGRIDLSLPGIWRYRPTLGLPDDAPVVTLGEGNTPLIPLALNGRTIHFKHEGLNPTGAFKDRGMAVVFSWLRLLGVTEAIEDSSGNAGASFAAYAACSGVKARVFVPAGAAGAKRRQIEAYGADLVAIDGPRSKAAEAARAAALAGAVYASHVFNPLGLLGNATCAYEIVAQLGRAPEAVILPVGHGTLLLGLSLGFQALKAAGVIPAVPRLIGVQAMACAPLWAVAKHGRQGLDWVTEGETIAEGIRVVQPLRGDAVLAAITASGGSLYAIDDDQIRTGHGELARRGLFVELTSAAVWPVLAETSGDVVAILTGHGLKSV